MTTTKTAPQAIRETEAAHDERVFRPQTDLGRELWELRQRIVAAGESLLDADQIEAEVDRRRGGVGRWDP